jgi:hypothetical protein
VITPAEAVTARATVEMMVKNCIVVVWKKLRLKLEIRLIIIVVGVVVVRRQLLSGEESS